MSTVPKILAKISEEFALTEKERHFAKFIAEGKNPELAHKLAGYGSKTSNAWYKAQKPGIVAYAQKLQKQNEHYSAMSRKKVMDGFMEAIEQAKLMSEPMTQISGWREIAKMCGYYAPEVRKIDINVTSQRVLSQLETLSDQDLLELIEKDAELIEGEAREILSTEAPNAGPDEREAEVGAGESGAGEEESDSLRQADVPEVQRRLGA